MPFELVKDTVSVINKIGEEKTQLLLEGDVIVPDSRPDIYSILRSEGTVSLEPDKVTDDRANFKGALKVNVLYEAKNTDKPVHIMTADMPIDDFINIEGITRNSAITVSGAAEHLECKLVNDRKINIRAVISVKAEASEARDIEFTEDIKGDSNIQVRKSPMTISGGAPLKHDVIQFKEEINIPSGKPNISELITSDITIADKDIRALDGRIMAKGLLKISIMYYSVEGNLETIENELPINGFIDAENISDGMIVNGKIYIGDKKVYPEADEDGEERKLDIDLDLIVEYKAEDSRSVEVVDDIYSLTENIEPQREIMKYPVFVCRNKNKASIRQNVTIDSKYPDIMRIYNVWGNASVDNIKIGQDMLLAEGVVNIDIFYLAKDDKSPAAVVPVTIPFEQTVELKGAREGMDADLSVEIENIDFNLLTEREAEIRATVVFDVFVNRNEENSLVVGAEVLEDGGTPKAGAVIYTVQKGDTLWNIAKKYNTTVDDILMVNEIEYPDDIYEGERILVLKKELGRSS